MFLTCTNIQVNTFSQPFLIWEFFLIYWSQLHFKSLYWMLLDSLISRSVYKYLSCRSSFPQHMIVYWFSSTVLVVYRYSWDEGETWNSYTFHNETIRVYGVLTEPGEATAIFSIFGSHLGYHKWLIIQVNMDKVFSKCRHTDATWMWNILVTQQINSVLTVDEISENWLFSYKIVLNWKNSKLQYRSIL